MEEKFDVLIVGDDAGLASHLQDILEAQGYGTAAASDGKTALTLFETEAFDLVLVDMRLPDMPGLDLIHNLTKLRPEVRYVITTGYSSLDGAIQAVERKNTVGYLTKPLNVDHLLALVGQVLERNRAEAASEELALLREVDRLRSQLLGNVSHELRTPLTAIKGFASTLLRTDVRWSEEEQRDYLQTIDRETDRLSRLISDLLDMSRIESGGLKLVVLTLHVSEILDSTRSELAELTGRHQLRVRVACGLPPVLADQARVGQVLANLVENAARHSPEDSEITIEAQPAEDQVYISVADRGEGIPAELRDRVFDRFYQAESIVAGRKSGTGLGLSICRGIAEAHGGRIWVESELGEGAKFTFSLPVSKGEEEFAQDSGY